MAGANYQSLGSRNGVRPPFVVTAEKTTRACVGSSAGVPRAPTTRESKDNPPLTKFDYQESWAFRGVCAGFTGQPVV
jgi:hypothetical protein